MEVFFSRHKQNSQLRQNIFRSIRDVGRLVSSGSVAREREELIKKKGSRNKKLP